MRKKIKQMVLSEFNSFRTFMNKDYLDIWFNSIKASLDYYLTLSTQSSKSQKHQKLVSHIFPPERNFDIDAGIGDGEDHFYKK